MTSCARCGTVRPEADQDGLDGLIGLAGDLRPEWIISCRFGSLVIAKINDLFSGDHPDSSVRSVVTHVKDRLEDSETLQQQAQNNTLAQFSASPDLHSEFPYGGDRSNGLVRRPVRPDPQQPRPITEIVGGVGADHLQGTEDLGVGPDEDVLARENFWKDVL
jgi:hypothetical protein